MIRERKTQRQARPILRERGLSGLQRVGLKNRIVPGECSAELPGPARMLKLARMAAPVGFSGWLGGFPAIQSHHNSRTTRRGSPPVSA